jgi:hypothetical protein
VGIEVKPAPAKKASGRNVTDAERGDRGEQLGLRVRRGTKARIAALATTLDVTKGEVVEMAIERLEQEKEV